MTGNARLDKRTDLNFYRLKNRYKKSYYNMPPKDLSNFGGHLNTEG